MTDDYVARIRAVAKEQTTLGQAFDMLHVADVIESLLAAGDAMRAFLVVNSTTAMQQHPQYDAVIDGWESARV